MMTEKNHNLRHLRTRQGNDDEGRDQIWAKQEEEKQRRKSQRKVTWKEPIASSVQLQSTPSPPLNSTSPSFTTSPEMSEKLLANSESHGKCIPPPLPPSALPKSVEKTDPKEKTGLKRKIEGLIDDNQAFKRPPLSPLSMQAPDNLENEKRNELGEFEWFIKDILAKQAKDIIEKCVEVAMNSLTADICGIIYEEKHGEVATPEGHHSKEVVDELMIENQGNDIKSHKESNRNMCDEFKAESKIAIAKLKEKLDESQIIINNLRCEKEKLEKELSSLKNNKNDDIVNEELESINTTVNQRGLELEAQNPKFDQTTTEDGELDLNALPYQPLPYIPEENEQGINVEIYSSNPPQPAMHLSPIEVNQSPPQQPNNDHKELEKKLSTLVEEKFNILTRVILRRNSNSVEQSSRSSSCSSRDDSSDDEYDSRSKKYRKKRKNKKKDKKKKEKRKQPEEMKRDAMEQLRFLEETITGRGMRIRKDDERIRKCKACRKTVSSKQYLIKHIKTAHLSVGTEPREICPVCNNTFSSRSNLNAHIKDYHPVPDETVPK